MTERACVQELNSRRIMNYRSLLQKSPVEERVCDARVIFSENDVLYAGTIIRRILVAVEEEGTSRVLSLSLFGSFSAKEPYN